MAVKHIAFKSSANVFSGTHVNDTKVILRYAKAADDNQAKIYGQNGSGTLTYETVTAGTGEGQIERITSATFDTVDYIDLGGTDTTGVVRVFSNDGTAGTGDIRVDSNPANNDTLEIGLTGFTETATFKTTVAGDDQIKIGSTPAETADNIASWINDASTGTSSPVDGTDWQRAGVAPAGAHDELTATVSASTVTVTDKCKCSRQLAWVGQQGTGATLTIRTPTNAVDGTELTDTTAGLPAGERYVSTVAGLDLDAPAVSTVTLPETLTGPTDKVRVAGRYSLILQTGTPWGTTSPSITLEASNDGTNWYSDGATVSALTTSDLQQVEPTSMAEYARLNMTANPLSASVELDAKFITQS